MKNPHWRKCVICADSRDIIKQIPDNSIDVILTDPPYNIGIHTTGNIHIPGRAPINDVVEWDLVDFNPEEWVEDFIRILKPTGNLFIFTTYNQLGRWYNALDHRFDTSNFMVWHKTNPTPKIFKAGFLNSCEMVFTCWNKRHTWNFISQAEMHNFLESPICMGPERVKNPKHPAQKPISILKKLIQIASNTDDIIFDPFMGVGSVGVAALQLGRKFIGVEINSEYFRAAQERINKEMDKNIKENNFISDVSAAYVASPVVSPINISTINEIEFETHRNRGLKKEKTHKLCCLEPILKWAGGKEKELKYILPHTPPFFDNYYEPFVGGGSVFCAMSANRLFINDFSKELISLYRGISQGDKNLFDCIVAMDKSWENATLFLKNNNVLIRIYENYRCGNIANEELTIRLKEFCAKSRKEIKEVLDAYFEAKTDVFLAEVFNNLCRKMKRMRVLEEQKYKLPNKDVENNIETAIKSALYMYFRYLYNNGTHNNESTQTALFLFMRNYAYGGMFRYSNNGAFNVPYGGIAYNSKTLSKKLSYYKSEVLSKHFERTTLFNLDFEEFLRKNPPTERDFVFLDPPYDSEFSTYAQKEFTQADHMRLFNYLTKDCRAKWMLVIKNTDFIYNLYGNRGLNIRMFDKKYQVSFMNRNNKEATHLIITNY